MKVSKTLRLEDLGTELSLIPQSLQDAAYLALELPYMAEFARAFCPVRTGALRGSIRVERPGPAPAPSSWRTWPPRLRAWSAS